MFPYSCGLLFILQVMNNQLKRQNEAVSRLGEELEQSEKKEGSLQVGDTEICVLFIVHCVVYAVYCIQYALCCIMYNVCYILCNVYSIRYCTQCTQ